MGVLAQNLSDQDKQNLAALITDKKYHSLVKLMANIKAQWLQQVFHGKVSGEDILMRRGGVMMLQMLEQMVETEFSTRYANMADEKAKEDVLNGLGY